MANVLQIYIWFGMSCHMKIDVRKLSCLSSSSLSHFHVFFSSFVLDVANRDETSPSIPPEYVPRSRWIPCVFF